MLISEHGDFSQANESIVYIVFFFFFLATAPIRWINEGKNRWES